MGFYFRKSKKVGPVRLNFSKSGVGVSTGVKGARISFGPRGTYVNVGRNGVYYRKKIGSKKKRKAYSNRYKTKQNNYVNNRYPKELNYEPEPEIIDEIRLVNNEENESDIGRTIRKGNSIISFIAILWFVISIGLLFTIKWKALIFAVVVRILIEIFGVVRIDYELDETATQEWDDFLESFQELMSCNKIWMVEGSSYYRNTKTHAGATRDIKRSVTKIKKIPWWRKATAEIRSNILKMQIDGTRCKILFLPSDVVITQSGREYIFPYDQLEIRSSYIDFVEHSKPVRDAYVKDYTYQYVNKDGSPDMRYKNNYSYPICRYGVLIISAHNGLRIELHTSNDSILSGFVKGFKRYQRFCATQYDKEIYSSKSAKAKDIEPEVLYDLDHDSQLNKIFDDADSIVIDVAKSAVEVLEESLGCSIKLIDGALHNREGLALYEADNRVDYKLKKMQKLFDEKAGHKFRFQPVSEERFLAYITIDGFSKMPAERPLSGKLTNAVKSAEIYQIKVDKFVPEAKKDVYNFEENNQSIVDRELETEETFEPLPDSFEELFSVDDNSANEDERLENSEQRDKESKMVDDIMDFFD